MKERGILFSAPMVRAILAGQKTQTRRIVKWPKSAFVHGRRPFPERSFADPGLGDGIYLHAFYTGGDYEGDAAAERVHCPYGVPGDQLWVRENFRLRRDQDDVPPSQDWWKKGCWYAADPNTEPSGCAGGSGKLRPAIHMPRWASRITLEITDVRVQRVQEITEADAWAEGVIELDGMLDEAALCRRAKELGECATDSRTWFAELWDQINRKRAPWSEKPWVWAITFKRVFS